MKTQSSVGKMAQWMKWLSCKEEEHISDLQPKYLATVRNPFSFRHVHIKFWQHISF